MRKPIAVEKRIGAGRPSEMTPDKIMRLEEVFCMDGTVEEACLFAGITKTTYYNWIEKHPELYDRFEEMKQRPILKARKTVIDSLDVPQNAQWFLARKRKAEFSERVEQTGADGKELPIMGIVINSPNGGEKT